MNDFGTRLIKRLEDAANRNKKILDSEEAAQKKLSVILPVLLRGLQGDEITMAAIREIYGLLEANAEERQSTIVEIKELMAMLEYRTKLLEEAGLDFANIQTFSNDEIWLGDHLPTIKRALNVFNLAPTESDVSLFEQALDSLEKERFEDIAHTIQRSGKKRENKVDVG